jgi:hypothetical protein
MVQVREQPVCTHTHKNTHTHTHTQKAENSIWWWVQKWIANEKNQKKSLLSKVGKIPSKMSRMMIYVKETRKHTQKDTMGLA